MWAESPNFEEFPEGMSIPTDENGEQYIPEYLIPKQEDEDKDETDNSIEKIPDERTLLGWEVQNAIGEEIEEDEWNTLLNMLQDNNVSTEYIRKAFDAFKEQYMLRNFPNG